MNKKQRIRLSQTNPIQRPGWREYQLQLQHQSSARHTLLGRMRWLWLLIPLCGLLWGGLELLGKHFDDVLTSPDASISHAPPVASVPPSYDKHQIQSLIDNVDLAQLEQSPLQIENAGHLLTIQTSLDGDLQTYLKQKLDLRHSRYIGIVAMEPATGRILSMVGFDKTDPKGNPCVQKSFPAASIFKIITAAAAVERCALTSQSRLKFNGSKHTLYKSQLKERNNRYTHRISLQDAFAQSVNPVFGKLGTLRLGKSVLEAYAQAFGFNRDIDFELALAPSRIEVSDKPYHWAEIASGFNRDTRISVLHGALIAAAVVNQGQLIEPAIVDHITDANGNVLYQHQKVTLNEAISSHASREVTRMMKATVRSGTGRKAFRGLRRDRVLSKLEIGGKTGSIFNKAHDARLDWFVGYAQEKEGSEQIALSVVVAHEEYIGTRAGQYARMLITQYFKTHFAQNRGDGTKANG